MNRIDTGPILKLHYARYDVFSRGVREQHNSSIDDPKEVGEAVEIRVGRVVEDSVGRAAGNI